MLSHSYSEPRSRCSDGHEFTYGCKFPSPSLRLCMSCSPLFTEGRPLWRECPSPPQAGGHSLGPPSRARSMGGTCRSCSEWSTSPTRRCGPSCGHCLTASERGNASRPRAAAGDPPIALASHRQASGHRSARPVASALRRRRAKLARRRDRRRPRWGLVRRAPQQRSRARFSGAGGRHLVCLAPRCSQWVDSLISPVLHDAASHRTSAPGWKAEKYLWSNLEHLRGP
jgi:hypothetical protein